MWTVDKGVDKAVNKNEDNFFVDNCSDRRSLLVEISTNKS